VKKDTKGMPQLASPHQKFMNFLNPEREQEEKAHKPHIENLTNFPHR
jgi:hypothetical protein